MRSPRLYLLVLLLALALANLWSTFHRSGIPVALSGRVERVELRTEKHPGLDDVYLVRVGGRTTHLDADVASLFEVGADVQKAAWSRSLTTSRGVQQISVSTDFKRMTIAMPLIVALGLILLRVGARPE